MKYYINKRHVNWCQWGRFGQFATKTNVWSFADRLGDVCAAQITVRFQKFPPSAKNCKSYRRVARSSQPAHGAKIIRGDEKAKGAAGHSLDGITSSMGRTREFDLHTHQVSIQAFMELCVI